MEKVADFDFFPLEFNRDGQLVQRAELDALLDFLTKRRQTPEPITDLIVLAHGWNNDIHDARVNYGEWLGCARSVLNAGPIPGLEAARFAVLGVLWPSKKYAEADLIPGNAADFAGGDDPLRPLPQIEEQIDVLIAAAETPEAAQALQEAKQLLPAVLVNEDPAAQKRFADLVRAALQREPGPDEQRSDDAADSFYRRDGRELFDLLSSPPDDAAGPSDSATTEDLGGAAAVPIGEEGDSADRGGAQGFGDLMKSLFKGPAMAARNLLNLSTYYQMKARAGMIGRSAVYEALQEVTQKVPGLRLHLIGHSFGGRLATATALGPEAGGAPLPIASLTLLQAAYSHNGLGENYDNHGANGFFHAVLTQRRVAGPVVITHTVNDQAVGLAYPLASRISHETGAALGDAHDIYGGMGRNGAQHTPGTEFLAMQPVGAPYAFRAGGVHNLMADAYIKEHSDLAHNEVAYAFLRAIAAGIEASRQ